MVTKKAVLILVITILCFLPTQVIAIPEWESIGPNGGDQFDIKISPANPNTLFALAGAGVHRSTDAGLNWQPVHNATMSDAHFLALSFDPQDATHLFLASTLDGIWESHNQGDSWVNCTDGLPLLPGSDEIYYPVISLEFDSTGRLFAGLSQIEGYIDPPSWIYRSDNGCNNWLPDDSGVLITATELTQDVSALLSLDSSNQLWAMVYGGGIYKYEGAGGWVSHNGNLPDEGLQTTFLEHDPTDSNHMQLGTELNWIYETLDSGQTWNAMPLPDALTGLQVLPLVYAITIDPNNSQVIYADANDASGSLEQPIFKPAIGYQTSGGNNYTSFNGGLDWIERASNFFRATINPNETVTDFIAPYGNVTRSRVWYRTTGGGMQSMQKSDDGGLTFNIITNGLNNTMVNKVWVHPSPPPAYNSLLFSSEEGYLHLLPDESQTWQNQKAVQDYLYTWSFAADYMDPDSIYYSAGYPAWSYAQQNGIYRISIDCFELGCDYGDQILNNTGVWRVITTPLIPGTIYAATQEQGIMVSDDNGLNWSTFNDGLTLPMSITDIELDENGLPQLASFRTSNGDCTADPPQEWWPDPDEAGGMYYFDTPTSQWLLVSGINSAAFDIERDPWDPQMLFAATAQGVYKSNDNGQSWVLILPEVISNDLLIDPIKQGYLYTATPHGVLRSTNGGVYWHDFSNGLLKKHVMSLALDPYTDILYVGTSGNSVFKLLPEVNPQPAIAYNPASLDIGVAAVGFTINSSVIVTNEGESNLVIDSIVPADPAFTLPGLSLPITITPMTSVALEVHFSPESVGVVNSSISFYSNDPVSPVSDYAVTGEGRPAVLPNPDVKVNDGDGPVSISYGEIFTLDLHLSAGDYLGQESDIWIKMTQPDSTTLWLVNGSGWIESVTPLRFDVMFLQDFTDPILSLDMTLAQSGVNGIEFAVDDNWDGIYNFTWSDTVSITMGQSAPLLFLSPSEIDFGLTAVGLPKTINFAVANSGEQDLIIDSITADIGDFELIDPPIFPMTITYGESVVLSARFTPQSEGPVQGKFTIQSNDPVSPVIDFVLSGEGRPAVLPNPDVKINDGDGPVSISYGETFTLDLHLSAGDYLGQEADIWVKMTQPDSTTLWLVNGSGWVESLTPLRFDVMFLQDFTGPILSLDMTLAQSGVNGIEFAVDDNADGNYDVTWSDTVSITMGQSPPLLFLSPSVIDFGETVVGFSKTINFAVANGGEQDLVIDSITPDIGDFELVDPPGFPLTIAGGDSVVLAARFTPLSEGPVQGKFTIQSNDPVSPVIDFDLSGDGMAFAALVPDVKANGFDDIQYITQGSDNPITLSLDPGSYSGTEAEWWVVIFTLNPQTQEWTPVSYGSYKSPLFNLSPIEIFNTSSFAPGGYTIMFGVDMFPNGTVDFNQLIYDLVPVIISP